MARYILPALIGATASVALLLAAPAQAQKASDTVRFAVANAISTIFTPSDPQPQTDLASHAVFDNLLCYDDKKLDFAPQLAESWSQPNDHTIELKLRTDVKFHDGTPFTADDVVYSLHWLRDPNNKLRFSADYFTWLDRVEKVDDYTVRLLMKEKTALALIRLALSTPIVPAKLHSPYVDKAEFGRKTPVGTGPYKAVSVDPTNGVTLVRNENYHGNACKPAAKIGHVHILTIPDAQTEIAQLFTGGIDVFRGDSKDQTEMLAANPALAVTPSQGVSFYFMSFDAAGRSGNAAIANLKVRQAIVRAIDRAAVARNVLPGGATVEGLDALCLPNHRGCDYTTKPLSYDPAAAKALLAEAGYPDGFDTEIAVVPGGGTMAEAVAGELRKIGIRAKVDKGSFTAYRQKQRDGKAEIIIGTWTMGGLPDVSATTDYFFDGGPRDYARDAGVTQWAKEGLATLEEGKRKAIYRKLFDRVNEKVYALPLSTSPGVFVHTKDLAIEPGSFSNYDVELYEMSWK